MWPLRVYTRKRAGQRLNLTPTPGLGSSAPAEARAGPGGRLAAHRLKGNGTARGLRKIAEKAEQTGQGRGGSGRPSSQLGVAAEKSLQESSASEEETRDEKMAPLSEPVTDDLQVESSSSSDEVVSGLSSQRDISSSLPSYSVTDSYTECKSFEENLSSFPSPELFRGSDYLDWECPRLEEHIQCKNSTLLDTSKAVAIEKAPQFSNLSSILYTSSEDYQKCHRKIVMTLADENISPKPKGTSNLESDNAACKVLAEKTYPLTPEKTKKKPGKDPEPRGTNSQTKLSSHLKIKIQPSHQRSDLESNADKSVTKVLLPQPLGPALDTNPTIPDKKSRGLLTSTPTSQTAGLEIDLSSVQKASLEELFPNVSNCVNSDEIVPVSSLQEHFSNEVPSNISEICCIIRASPGTRQVKSKSVIVKKKKFSFPKDIPQDIIIKTNGRM
ncbi:meiosis-specific kinetochore protein [Artibeus jamaicensis]|uniref:meiosis-specific kinetochore protein n=1 Tax=Artibeus jamaicensis TaxID=9417 RepID=UPI00235AA3B6|nr:meiosis-specific kinetochore protein [Artibeus jamaicensis]